MTSTDTITTRRHHADELGCFAYWPENLFWSFQFIRLASACWERGADFSEVHHALRDVEVGNADSWYEAFAELAMRVENSGDTAAERGHVVTAKDAWLRASNYHRSAGFFLLPNDPRAADAVVARRRCFQQAIQHLDHRVEPVEIPYETSSLPGYIMSPHNPAPGSPAVVVFGGADAIAEEMYLFIGRALVERGLTVLAIDGPGQGEALRRGIVARHDFEVPVTATLDHLLATEPHVDPDRLGLIGQSLGGFYATRAAALEPRLRATVVWSLNYDVYGWFQERIAANDPSAAHFLEQFQIVFGVDDAEAVLECAKAYNLTGVPQRIRGDVLVVQGEDDLLCPLSHAQRVYDEIPHDRKELVVYRSGEPGCTHCQADSLPAVHRDIGDWLQERL